MKGQLMTSVQLRNIRVSSSPVPNDGLGRQGSGHLPLTSDHDVCEELCSDGGPGAVASVQSRAQTRARMT